MDGCLATGCTSRRKAGLHNCHRVVYVQCPSAISTWSRWVLRNLWVRKLLKIRSMGKFKTPQEKKRLSYQHDRRDDYMESSKGSRRSIRWRKRWVNQTYRQSIKQILSVPIEKEYTDEVENQLAETRRPCWKKRPHAPLGLYLYQKGKLSADKLRKLTFRVREQSQWQVCKGLY